MAKRVFLFVVVNILVVTTLGIVLYLLGVDNYLTAEGLNYGSLLVFCAVFGFGGALISLSISRWMAIQMMRVQIIDPTNPRSGTERELLQTVYRFAQKAGLPEMPWVGIYESPEVNAFATGPSKRKSLVAVSSGLLERMDAGSVEGVLSHEIAHIANGDMVTMTLIQGVVNTFVMFFARAAAWGISQAMGSRDRNEGSNPLVYFICMIVFQVVFSFLGMMVVSWFSRWREFRADAGGASLGGREKMVHALESLQRSTELVEHEHESLAAFKISSGKRAGALANLFRTHPPLEDRIAALRKLA